MKKLPNIPKKRIGAQSLAVLALVALMLAVTYLGSLSERTATVLLPIERVSSEPTPEPAPEDETPPTEKPVTAAAQSSFAEYRLELTSARATAATLLNEVIGNSAASADTVQAAISQKAALARSVEVETAIETLLFARGFADALCTAREGSVNVIVRAEQLTQQQAAQILDIAMAESGEPAANIRIIPAQ